MGKSGNKFENYVKRLLNPYDFYITRSAASKGVYDLICLAKGQNTNIGIQCKGAEEGKITNLEKEEMLETADRYNLIPVLATKRNGRVVFIDVRTDVVIRDFNDYLEPDLGAEELLGPSPTLIEGRE